MLKGYLTPTPMVKRVGQTSGNGRRYLAVRGAGFRRQRRMDGLLDAVANPIGARCLNVENAPVEDSQLIQSEVVVP